MSDGKPYAISEDCTAFFTALKATKNEIYDACVIDYENNTIIYDISRENDNGEIVSQVTAAVGEVKCQIKLIGNDGGIITAPTFSIVVGDTLYSEKPIVEDSTEFTALTTYIATLEKRIADGEFNGPQGEQGPQGVSGVYVGSGDMPEDCNVQIDPDGAVMVVDTKLSTTSTNPVQNKAIAQKFNEIITKNGTVISTIADYAEIGEWSDGNPDNEDRTGYFVSIDPTVPGPEIKIAASTEDVRGAIMRNPGFSANATKDKFDANGELSPKYAYVGIMGLVPIIDKGRCTINQKCMPADDGTAIPANSDFGYQVADRIDENTVLVVIEPNADAINRIYAEMAKISGGGGSGGSIEIVDNLTSYDTDKALSVNMGRVLNEKKVDIKEIMDVVINFDDWEQGDIKATGNNATSTTVLRTSGYHQLPYKQIVITPSNNYKCGARWYTKDGDTYTRVGSTAAVATEFIIEPNPNYYYRFVIAYATSGKTADKSWASNVSFVSKPTKTLSEEIFTADEKTALANLRLEEIISPDYEIIDLPNEVGEWQSIVKVGDELWLCDESTTVHGDLDGYIYRLNISDFSYIGTFVHNLGHLNSVDYDVQNDRLITGSASNASTETPKIWIFENVLSWTEKASLDYANLIATEIDLTSDIHPNSSYINVCWGERDYLGNRSIYVNSQIGKKWFKIYPTIESDTYTGGYTVDWVKDYAPVSIPNNTNPQVIQDMKLYKGKIIGAITHVPITCGMWHFTSGDVATRTIIKSNWNGSGANEGLVIIGDYIYAGISQIKKLAKFKI